MRAGKNTEDGAEIKFGSTGRRRAMSRLVMVPEIGTILVLALAPALGGEVPKASEQPRDAVAPGEVFSVDVSGDGVPDTIESIITGDNRVEARDGRTKEVLWTSSCYWRGWGDSPLGRFHWPLRYDVDGDEWADLVFPARGCGDASIVALHVKTGSVLWRVPVDDPLGVAAQRVTQQRAQRPFSRSEDWESHILVSGERILLAARDETTGGPGSDKHSRGVVALNLRDGSVCWRKAGFLTSYARYRGNTDGWRTESPEAVSLTFQPAASIDAGHHGNNVSQWISIWVPGEGHANLADTVAVLTAGPALVYAGGNHVQAIRLLDGSDQWTWRIPAAGVVESPGLLYHEGSIFLVTWLRRREYSRVLAPPGQSPKNSQQLLVAALDAATGAARWTRTIPLPLRVSGAWGSSGPCSLSFNLSDRISITYTSPRERKVASTTLLLDPRTGEDIKAGE